MAMRLHSSEVHLTKPRPADLRSWPTVLIWLAAPCLMLLPACAHHHSGAPIVKYELPLRSPGAKFGTLPPVVQNTIRAEAGTAEIDDILDEHGPGGTTYEVRFHNAAVFPPLLIAQDGSVLRQDHRVAVGAPGELGGVLSASPVSGVKLNELPAEVLNAILNTAPDAPIDFIDRQTWGNRIIYIISFEDPTHHPKIYVASDGTVLNHGAR